MCVSDPAQLGRLFAKRANTGDPEGMLALYEDDATFVGPDGGSASGRDAIRERLKARQILAQAGVVKPDPRHYLGRLIASAQQTRWGKRPLSRQAAMNLAGVSSR